MGCAPCQQAKAAREAERAAITAGASGGAGPWKVTYISGQVVIFDDYGLADRERRQRGAKVEKV